jgi:hypothetical protein
MVPLSSTAAGPAHLAVAQGAILSRPTTVQSGWWYTSCAATWLPMNPAAPVTKMLPGRYSSCMPPSPAHAHSQRGDRGWAPGGGKQRLKEGGRTLVQASCMPRKMAYGTRQKEATATGG